ncbi:MAG: tetratricopeptide repeat protein [Gemmatales bacterium]|nr:tetratricopeptide repeat protein [Gemmatales bacterium]MDW8387878.1 tetratricopeptide repeat protein [Gemmatales bacterium]
MVDIRTVSENVGKGLAVGLLVVPAVETWLAPTPPGGQELGLVFGAALVGLLAGLIASAVGNLRRLPTVRGRWIAFLLFLVLEHPALVYVGAVGGLAVGVVAATAWAGWPWHHLGLGAAAGLGLGLLLTLFYFVPNRWLRSGTILAVAAAAAVGLYLLIYLHADPSDSQRRLWFGVTMLAAAPLLFALTLAGRIEETEFEIGLICAALGLGLYFLLPPTAVLLAVVLPLLLYVFYTLRVMTGLRVLKHTLRGMSYFELGRHDEALQAYRRALALDPRNRLAREGQWQVHRQLDPDRLAEDASLMALIDPDLCLNRARDLLLEVRPSPEMLAEAHKLLNLAERLRPACRAAVEYWRAVAFTHARDLDRAEAILRTLLEDSAWAPDDVYREAILLPAWQLALVQHSELRRRVGLPLIEREKRRLDALAVVERRLAQEPRDDGARELKEFLYEGLSEGEVRERIVDGKAPAVVDYEHCKQMGLALLNDPARWQRGVELLRIAALGLPTQAPGLFTQIVAAHERNGDTAGAREAFSVVKKLVRDIGLSNLSETDRRDYFALLKHFAEQAMTAGHLDEAIENFTLYSEAGQSGQDTLRLLTELHEKKGDALSALIWNERALMYEPGSRLGLERKDRYYYSVTPEQLQARWEEVKPLFDIRYCLLKAKQLLDLKRGGPEQVDWALHLAELARVAAPESIMAKVLAARCRLRRGETDQAVTLLESAYGSAKPTGFGSAEEEDHWYLACRMLGDLYLQTLGRPDQALQCFSIYRKHPKSGVDTIYKMGQCYEALGDRVKASKCYQSVVAYDHPLASDAYSALQRLGST